MQVELTEEQIKNTLVCIKKMWANGEVREEEAGAALSALRHTYEEAMKPKQEAPK